MNRATTQTHLERLEWLKSRLKANEPMILRDIADELGVSQRTLSRDIKILREQGLPVEADRGRGGGVRLAPEWGVGRISLTHREAINLLIGIAVTEKMEAQVLTVDLLPLRRKLIASFSQENQRKIRQLRDRIRVGPSASAEVLSHYKAAARRINDDLQEAFLLMNRVAVTYRSASGEATRRTIEPHYLILNYPVWYALCWDDLRGDVRTFRLDRIKVIALTGERFALRSYTDFEAATQTREVIVP